MTESAIVKYSGAAPGANTNDSVLFDTTVACPGKRMIQGGGLTKIVVSIHHVGGDGTLKIFKSVDRGVNWIAADTGTIALTAANSPHLEEFFFEPYDDFKVVWTNGGSAQTTWVVSIALVADP